MTSTGTEAAEAALRAAGYPQVRVALHGNVARLTVPESDLQAFAAPGTREKLVAAVRAAGFRFVALDLDGE